MDPIKCKKMIYIYKRKVFIGFVEKKRMQKWLRNQPSTRSMSADYELIDDDYAAVVAAAAFAIYSLEEEERKYLKKKREGFEGSRDKKMSKKEDIKTRLARPSEEGTTTS